VRRVRDAQGFTLLEIIVVFVIMAMAAVLVAPAIESGLRQREVRSAVRTLAGAMNALTSDAVRTGKPQDLVLDPMENALVVPGRENETVPLGEIAHMARLEGGSVRVGDDTRAVLPEREQYLSASSSPTPAASRGRLRRDARSPDRHGLRQGCGVVRARGFTLIEIAVAMAILGVGIVTALQVFGGSVQLARVAGKKSEAVMHAKALMDSVLWAPELVADVSHGEIGDGFRWERTIREAGPDDGIEETDDRIDVKLAVVTVKVEWDDPNGVKAYTIETMRIVPDTGENNNGGDNNGGNNR
jgi:general secretion pathway protein I